MNDNPKRKRLLVLIVVTMVLAILAFGAGLLVGKSSVQAAPEQTPPVIDEPVAPALDDPVSVELSACRRKLARRATARETPSAVEGVPEEPQEATAEQQRQIEALERLIKTCRRSEVVHSASVCKTVRRHVDLMMALPQNGKACRDKRHVVELIKMNLAACANFRDIPGDLDTSDLTDEEMDSVLEAVAVSKSLTKEDVAQLDLIYPTCVKISGKPY